MSDWSSLKVVVLTPPGRGAVASLLVAGPGAVDAVDSMFRALGGRPLGAYPQNRLVFGHFESDCGEEVVVRRRGDGEIELHCHGGYAAVAMIRDRLAARGCRVVAWQDWIAQGAQDPITSAAHVALAEARTERTAAILLDQYQGALRRAFDEIEHALEQKDAPRALRLIDGVTARSDLGRHLTRPWQVVLGGRPNVGKSSLINALMGYARAIVHPAPGTTRDVVTATTAIDGWPVQLSDTAGLHAGNDAVERAGIAAAGAKLAAADLVVMVFDCSRAWSAPDRSLQEAWPEALVVHNKVDLPRGPGLRPAGLFSSALSGQAIEALAERIAERLVSQPPPPGAAVPFCDEQFACLARWKLLAQRLQA